MAKILIIDDDGIVRDALAVFLTRAGHEVLSASDGVNGLLVFRNSAPDLVLLDRDLPGLSGSEVLAGIKEADPAARVIILTGYDSPDDAAQYLRSGATSFLSKGDGLSSALAEIDRLFGAPSLKTARPVCGGPSACGETAPGGCKILVADDDESIRSVLCRFLTAEGYTVVTAADGGQALAAVERETPDIVLLDIRMPVRNGFEVLEELRRIRPDLGVMMITGNDDEAVARACLNIGAFDYLSKPINLSSLGTVIRARLLLQKGR